MMPVTAKTMPPMTMTTSKTIPLSALFMCHHPCMEWRKN
jgi:hypothetical protein